MRKISFILLFVLTLVARASMAQETYSVPHYDIVSCGTGLESTYSAEVSVYQKKPNKDVEANVRKAAVHGALFKGLSAGNGGRAQRPIVDAATEKQHADFFNSFFSDEARYSRYVTVVDGSIRVEKTEKKLYRVRAVVSIQKDALRADLEKENIIESFKKIF